jgi:hypothetical protein
LTRCCNIQALSQGGYIGAAIKMAMQKVEVLAKPGDKACPVSAILRMALTSVLQNPAGLGADAG